MMNRDMLDRVAEALYLDSNNFAWGAPEPDRALSPWPPRMEIADWWRAKARLVLEAVIDDGLFQRTGATAEMVIEAKERAALILEELKKIRQEIQNLRPSS